MIFCESQGLPTQNRSGSWASNASNEDADDNNSSSLCTQSRIDKWKAKHEAARFVVILVLVRGIRGRAAGSVLGTKAEAACRGRLMRHCRISHPGLIDLQCGGCKKEAESKVKHTVTNSATQGRRNWGHKGSRGWLLSSQILAGIEAKYTPSKYYENNFPPNF